MKKYLVGAFLLLCSIAYAQVDKITYPANGSIFQQNASGNYSFSFGGTTRNKSGLPNLRYTLYKIDSDNVRTTIHNNIEIPSSNTRTNISGRVVFSFTGINLSKGYYILQLYSERTYWLFGKKRYVKDVIEFGVGDVYFIAGQSNAAGYNYPIGKLGPDNNFKVMHRGIQQLKSWIRGIHHSVDKKYLQAYLDEFCYRINRSIHKNGIFDNLMSRMITTKNITKNQIIMAYST